MFGIYAVVRGCKGGQIPVLNVFRVIGRYREARKENSLRGEQEERMRAMRLSGLEVEMNKMGRSKDMQDCEEDV